MPDRTIREALKRASLCLKEAGVEESRRDAEYLLAGIMKTDRLQLILDHDEILSSKIGVIFQEAVKRRCRAEPAAYIAGKKYFYGNRFIVNRDVLIPRPETELLVDCALGKVDWLGSSHNGFISGVDLGTGSGALAVTLALMLPDPELWAVDISETALKIAKLNAVEHGVQNRIHFLQGNFFDAFDALARKPKFNLIVSNPPYLGRKEMEALPVGVKKYEPAQALDGGCDGLQSYRIILERVQEFAAVPALLIMEAGAGQKEKVETLLSKTGLFSALKWHNDLNGWPRVIEGVIS